MKARLHPRYHVSVKTLLAIFILLAACTPAAPAARLRIAGDRLWLEAEREPIRNVLAAFATHGILVRLDPAIAGEITAKVAGQEIERAVEELLRPFDYVLIWKPIPGPLGTLAGLSEIQVFQPGRRDQARPLPAPSAPPATAARGAAPADILYMADELLVRATPGVAPAAFLHLVASIGGRVTDSLPAQGIYRIRLNPGTDLEAAIGQLTRSGLVAEAERHYLYQVPGLKGLPIPGSTAQAASPPIGADSRRLVTILDTGFRADTAASPSAVAWFDALGESASPVDRSGHGTHMALLASGAILPSGLPASAAPASALPVLACRVFDEDGYLTNFDLMRALDTAVAQGSRVVSLSWGSYASSRFLDEALSALTARGVIVVAAAGNEPEGLPYFPAAYPGVVAVAAVDAQGDRWPRSNYGPFVDLSAPGEAVLPASDGSAARYAGTSIAAAYTAGLLGQYLSRNPEAGADEALAALRAALTDAGEAGWDPHYGNGVLDEAAVGRLLP